MKNRIIFLCVALAMCFLVATSTVHAQFTQVWKVSAGTWPMMSTGDNSRGAALNSSNGHYLVTRRDIPRIYVFNAATGALLDSMNTTGVTGGTVGIQDIEVTSDGIVYGSNLILNTTSDTTFKIYRWANDNSATVPTVAYSGRPTSTASARLGDAFDVAGTGTNTVIYVGGNNAATNQIQVFTTADGINFTRTGGIAITGNDAGAGIAQVIPGGDFFTSRYSTGQPVRLYSGTGGGRKDLLPTTVTPALQADIGYLVAGGRKWLAIAESVNVANRIGAALFNITYGLSGAVKVGSTPRLGANVNINASSDVELQYNASDSTITLYVLVDNNGIGAYKTGNLLTVNLAPFAGNIVRTQFVPATGQNDTVYVDVQDDQYVPADSVKLYYNVNGGVNTVVIMTRTSGDSVKGTYRGIIPGASHTNGNRIAYFVTVADNQGVRFTSATSGYFAGLTKMTLAGPRAIDTATGAMLWSGYGIRVQGVCTQEDSLIAVPTSRHDVVIQDETGAMDLIEFAVSSVAPPWRMKRGRVYTVAGLLGQFRGKLQVAIPATGKSLEVTDNGPGVLPVPKQVTVRDLAFDRQGELYENMLVKISNVRLTASSLTWPSAGAAGTNLTITDNGIDSLTLRVPTLSNANGNPPLRAPFTVIGLAGQFTALTTAPFKDGYQVIMRHSDDIFYEVKVRLREMTKGDAGTEVEIPVMIENINGLGILGFQFDTWFDSTALQFVGASNIGSISSGYTLAAHSPQKGLAKIAASGVQALKDSGVIFNLRFKILKPGMSMIAMNGQFNEGNPVAMVAGGAVAGFVPYDDPKVVEAKHTAGITLDGKLDEADWANANTLVFGPSNAPKAGNERTVTGGFDIKASFDVNGVIYRLPYQDTSYTRVKFLRKGTELYIGIQSPDKSICKFDWEGDGLFMKIKNSAGEDKEYKLYYQNIGTAADTIRYEEQVLNSGSGAGSLAMGSKVNDTTNVDNGYSAELRIKLASLGFDATVKNLQVAINIFDPDGFQHPMAPWDSARGRYFKSWWGSEWGGTYRTIRLLTPYDNPDTIKTIIASSVTVDGKLTEPEWANANTLVFGPSDAPKTGNEKTVTGGVDVKANFDVNGVMYQLPYRDTSYTRVKFLQRGSDLFLGIQSPDKSICKFDWEGDGIFVQIKNKAGETKEYKLYYQNIGTNKDTIRYEESVLNSGAGAGSLATGSTVNDTTNIDNGYTAELRIRLASLGYVDGDKAVQISMNIFDPDGYKHPMNAWDSARGTYFKSWWGSEWGSSFRIIALDRFTGVAGTDQLPIEFALDQNFPNPFNPTTLIRFALPQNASTRLVIYDLLGREVRTLVNSEMNAGFHEASWDGKNNVGSQVATGVYIYRIEAGSFISTKKMMLLK